MHSYFFVNIKKITSFITIASMFSTVLLLAQSASDDLQLLGGISGKAKSGVALVKQRSSSTIKAIRLGEDVFGYGVLGLVDRFSMTIYPKNKKEPIVISSKFGGQKGLGKKRISTDDRYVEEGFERNGNKVQIDSNFRDKTLKEDLPNILMQATAEPVMENGTIIGFKMYNFDPESMFWKLGVKEGDVITSINGVPLNNVARTIQLLNGLRKEPNIQVAVQRNGTPTTLDLSVK